MYKQQTVAPQSTTADMHGQSGPANSGLPAQQLQPQTATLVPRFEPPRAKNWPKSSKIPTLIHARDDHWEYKSLFHVRFAILVPFLLWVFPPTRGFFTVLDQQLFEATWNTHEAAILWVGVVGITFAVLLLEKVIVAISGRDTTWVTQMIIALTFLATTIYWWTQNNYFWVLLLKGIFITGIYFLVASCILAIFRHSRGKHERRMPGKSHNSAAGRSLQPV